MALAKAALKTSIKNLILGANVSDIPDEDKNKVDAFAEGLSNAIDTFVKTGQVSVNSLGLVAPNGPVTGSANGTIS